ncbi:ABC transporter ATP-binding protein [Schlesneria paludicola]|uniref:ABC transporter ATP-binding protein n=1 Tax=Schlesneria paludicola TaxID=360056 RepID=UPI00029AA449|nr:ABC transporter ATP-binding protein [Schlesneria paludicola]
MKTWSRLCSFVWPYRRKLVLSVAFGILSASLWSVELLLTFPITVMVGEHHTLANYVQYEVTETSKAIESRTAKLEQLEAKLDQLPELGQQEGARRRSGERVSVIDALRQQRIELDVYTTKLWMLSWVESRIVRNLPSDEFQLFATLFALILLVTLVRGGFAYLQDVLAGSVAEMVVIDLRQQLFRTALKLDPQTIAIEGSSAWLTDLTYTLQNLANGLTELGGRVVREPLKAVSCLVALFYLNWKLSLVFFLFMPVLGVLFHWLGQQLKRAANRVIDSMGRLYKGLEETFHNAKAVIVFDQAGRHRRRFHREHKIFYQQAMQLVRIDALSGPITEMLAMLAATAVLLPAAYLVLRETTTIWGIPLAASPPRLPELALFYALLAGVLEPLRKFSKFYTGIRHSTAIAERFFARMDTPSLVANPVAPQLLPALHQKIEFRDVHFRYASAANEQLDRGPVLNGVNLTIDAGETIVIVGPNGSGKSTLVNLIARFCDPNQGDVLMDGVNLKDVRLRDVREQMALVSQDTLLFEGTIFENIRYGRPDASDDDVQEAARRAHVLEFAETMPQGLRTPVGDQGKQLSGGQRQRIALARAILRDSRILILDEPTSAIDAQSEQLIYSSLRGFTRGRTTILITHCLTPVLMEFLSRIVVLDHGRVVASGEHQDLLQACPIYQRLWAAQTQRAAA